MYSMREFLDLVYPQVGGIKLLCRSIMYSEGNTFFIINYHLT